MASQALRPAVEINRRGLADRLAAIEREAANASEVSAALMAVRAQMNEREQSFVVQLHRSARGLKAAARTLRNELAYQQSA